MANHFAGVDMAAGKAAVDTEVLPAVIPATMWPIEADGESRADGVGWWSDLVVEQL